MNQVVSQGYSSQITTVKHANGKDVWVIVHPYGSSDFNAILFTDNGVQAPVVSNIGPYIGGNSVNVLGSLTASHDGKLLAGTSQTIKGVLLFDFNNATGILTNYRNVPNDDHVSKLQFSPDNTKLYYICWEGISQYDFDKADIASSLTKIFDPGLYSNLYDMQLAPDGKIYVNKTGEFVNENYTEFTGAIECPNLPQYASNFNPKALPFAYVSFPNLINDFINDPHAPPVTKFDLGKDTAVCFGSYTITTLPDGKATDGIQEKQRVR